MQEGVHAAPQQAATDAELKDAAHDVPLLMQVLDVTSGMTVADVGAGAGAMTIVTARWLGPRGRVYSTDINEAQVRAIAAWPEGPPPGDGFLVLFKKS
jgi:predicted methyltransferase